MANKLIELIDSGKVRDLETLKRFFRRAAKRSHPDAVGDEDAARAFISLREDYEAALRYLEARADREAAETAAVSAEPAAATPHEAPHAPRPTTPHEAPYAPRPASPSAVSGGPAEGRQGGRPRKPQEAAAPRPRGRQTLAFDREAFYVELQDLFARGFPLLPKARAVRPAYEASRERVSGLAAAWAALPPGLFASLEAELVEMSSRMVEAHVLSAFRSSVYAVLDYHNTGFRHLKTTAERMCEPIRAELSSRGRIAAALFLEALESDLERGSALADPPSTFSTPKR